MASKCGHATANRDYGLEGDRNDPTGTATLQRRYARFLRGRIEALDADVRELLVDEDALGLGEDFGGRWAGLSSAETARRFDDWFQDAVQRDVLEPHQTQKVRSWFESATKNGIRTANAELRRFGVPTEDVDDILAQDAVQESINLQQEDARQRVESWMGDFATDSRQLVTAGLVGNVAKSALTRDVIERGQVYKSQVTGTASGRIVNQYNTTKLTAYDRVDPEIELDVEAEFRTAQDDRVCERCQSLAGSYTLEEAQEIAIPDDTHTLCRCQWVVTDVREVF